MTSRRRALLVAVGLAGMSHGARAQVAAPPELAPVIEAPRPRRWLHMAGEAAVLFGVLEAGYWLDADSNSIDFKYDVDAHNLRARFVTLEAWSLDDNAFGTNGWRHTAQGTANYLIARVNGFSALQSYAVTLGLSAVWEFFGEIKEDVSINDLIMTPRSGAVVGEALWQLGGYVRAPARRRTRRHDFSARLAAGAQRVASIDGPQGILRATIATEVGSIPRFDEPGREVRLYADPVVSNVRVTATWNDAGVTDFRAFARTLIAAWHRKDRTADGGGVNLLYGVSSAYEFGEHASPGRDTTRTKDRVAISHLLGPTVDVTVRRGAIQVRAVVDGYADFALVRNFAIDAFRAQAPDEPVRSTIERDNYHHAFGVTARGHLVARYRSLELDLTYQLDRFVSIQGLDSQQEVVVNDEALYDGRDEGALWVSGAFALEPEVAGRFEAGVEFRRRTGRIKSTAQAEREQRYLAGLRIDF